MISELQTNQIQQELQDLMAKVEKKVLPEISARIRAIAELVTELLPRVNNDLQHRHVLVQTATDYLPSMLEHSLNLPTAFARFHPLKNGKTARQVLLEQLIVREEHLQTIANDILSGDAEALLTHSRFLQSKFTHDTTWEL